MHENQKVEFFSNYEISDEDRDILMLYLENKRNSGGGEALDYSVDSTRRRLTVIYKDVDAKKRVLERQVDEKIMPSYELINLNNF